MVDPWFVLAAVLAAGASFLMEILVILVILSVVAG